ncbi:SH3 domain-containing protein [Bartonella sp. CB175]|uniref:SH3 domain-containing protein n=1 Tax=Bartonella sp. CB175 TaxID=3112256 RepID=UPI00300DD124
MLNKNFLSTTMILSSLIGAGLAMSESYANAGIVARVATGYAVLRTGPAKTYKTIAIVPAGEKVRINGCLSNKSWCALQYKGSIGWASARYLNVNNIPTVSFTHMRMKPNSIMIMKEPRRAKVKKAVSDFRTVMASKKIQKQVGKEYRYRRNANIDPTGVKEGDERTILNPLPTAHGISVRHVSAYNPMFPNDINSKNFERNETRYRIVTYPIP